MLTERRVLLGVSGGIAAYKSAYLARRLVEAGAQVRCVLTAAASRFLGEQTLSALTGNPVETRLFEGRTPIPHTELARWAEAVVVAPATADLMAKLAHGICDDLLSATLVAYGGPVLLAPAMHTEMWEHPATRRNARRLREDGYVLVGPAEGALAGDDEGTGRMAEPEEIVAVLEGLLAGDLQGWRVLVTAGGTREPLDPVRFIANRSSGKMGHAVAAEAAVRGAGVTLVTTSDLPVPPRADVVRVETAQQMAEAVLERAPDHDVVVMAAAVADFRPKHASEQKLRRADGPPEVLLEPTPDILGSLAEAGRRPFLVGFAAETGPPEGARPKAARVDLLVVNDVTAEGAGFGTDTNRVTLLYPEGRSEDWPLMSKRQVAARLWDVIVRMRGG